MTKRHPTRTQLKTLKGEGWRRCHKGLFWQSPYDQYFYSPPAAVVREAWLGAVKSQSEDEPPKSGEDSGDGSPESN